MRRVVRAVGAAVVAVGLAAVVGCTGREFAEVEGRVTLDGQPLANVQVVFLPDPDRGNRGNNASAYTDADGRYQLNTPRDNQVGTVVGPHRVVIHDLLQVVAPGGPGIAPSAPGATNAMASAPGTKPRRFPLKYGDAADTPFKDVDVKPGKQTFDFDLKSKG
jgi:hypothetical protein